MIVLHIPDGTRKPRLRRERRGFLTCAAILRIRNGSYGAPPTQRRNGAIFCVPAHLCTLPHRKK